MTEQPTITAEAATDETSTVTASGDTDNDLATTAEASDAGEVAVEAGGDVETASEETSTEAATESRGETADGAEVETASEEPTTEAATESPDATDDVVEAGAEVVSAPEETSAEIADPSEAAEAERAQPDEPAAAKAAAVVAGAESGDKAASASESADEGKKGKKTVIAAAKAKIASKSKKKQPPEAPHVKRFRDAKESRENLTGKVIGWNNGGFHVVIDKVTAFCPRSEMDTAKIDDPKSFVDQEFEFVVLRIQDRGRRIVVSRSKLQRKEAKLKARELLKKLEVGQVLTGTVDSIADFGAFVDLGGLRGLIHVSEISRQRVAHPSDELEVGQEVEVKIIRLEEKGKRISLSMKELLPDPWRDIREKYPEGELFMAKVDQAMPNGAVMELEPGLTGWLPRGAMSLPQNASVPRAYPVGKEVKVQIGGVDPRRQRLTLELEGKALEGSKADLRDFKKKADETRTSFGAMAAAFASLRKD